MNDEKTYFCFKSIVMTNNICCTNEHKGLRYKGFSLVFMQTFVVPYGFEFDIEKAVATGLFERIEKDIDSQIFVLPPNQKSIARFKLQGFHMDIKLDDPYMVHLEGDMYVEMSLFFNKTVSLTYRLVNDGKAFRSDNLLTTDHLIALAALNMGAEHWSMNDDDSDGTNINLELKSVDVSDLQVLEDGTPCPDNHQAIDLEGATNTFELVCQRYKNLVLQHCLSAVNNRKRGKFKVEPMRDLNYVMVDIWEDLQHYDDTFQNLGYDEAGIISHIYEHHKKELVGLMTSYPGEWPFRTEESYEDVCGCNIAIDTDDLVLVNQNMCVVLGTYGLRSADAPTDWAEHLAERSRYHVSWPEYLLILEMILAKKFTIGYVNQRLVDFTLTDSEDVDPQEIIAANSRISIEMTNLLLQLDAVKYSKFVSHKIMFDRTVKRLELDEDMEKLENIMNRVNDSMHNLSEYKSMKQSNTLNIVLGLISAVSLLEILFQPIELPFISLAAGANQSEHMANGVIWFSAILMVLALFLSVVLIGKDFLRSLFKRKRK